MTRKSIILFDGVCNLCNSSIDFILKRDKGNRFLVGSLQEEPGKTLLLRYHAKADYLDSLVLLENEKIFFKSTAALKIARNLSGLWPLFYGFILIPAFIRDPIYDWIGKNRYRWFGRRNTCRIPTQEEKSKFLTQDKIQLDIT